MFARCSCEIRGLNQHYPPGTQENYNNFASRNIMMEKGKELKSTEGRDMEIRRISERSDEGGFP